MDVADQRMWGLKVYMKFHFKLHYYGNIAQIRTEIKYERGIQM